MDSSKAPASFLTKRVRDSEVRVVVNGIALLCVVLAGVVQSSVPEMPIDVASVTLPLLVLTLDQGGIGSSGAYFAMGHLCLMMSVRWDRYHRGVNDMKLDAKHASNGLSRRVMLLTTYLYNIN